MEISRISHIIDIGTHELGTKEQRIRTVQADMEQEEGR